MVLCEIVPCPVDLGDEMQWVQCGYGYFKYKSISLIRDTRHHFIIKTQGEYSDIKVCNQYILATPACVAMCLSGSAAASRECGAGGRDDGSC